MKTEYIVKAFEEVLGEDMYKVTVPSGTSKNDVMKAFENATKYVSHSCDFIDGIEVDYDKIDELYEIYENNLSKYIELGKQSYDEHFEKMLEMEEEHRLNIFKYYIEKCMGWKIEDIIYDFEFEW